MTDIVVTDGLHLADSETHTLANRAISNGVATESINLGGSHYTIEVSDSIVTAESLDTTRKVIASITSSAASTDTDLENRALAIAQNGAVAGTATAWIKNTIESVVGSGNASETIDTGDITASYASTGNATELVTVKRLLVVTSAGVAASTPTVVRHTTMTVTDGVVAGATPESPAMAVTTGSGAATATATVTVRRVPASATGSGAATDSTALSKALREIDVESHGVAASTLTTTLHAISSVADSADATDRVRTSAEVIGNFWTGRNGAAALWEGLPFSSLLQEQDDGAVYGAGQFGLYLMGVAKDDGDPVRSRVTFDLLDFGSPQRKRWGGLYALGAADGPYTMTVVSNKGTFRYTTQATKEREAVQHRASPGRGLDSVKYRIDLQQTKPHATDQIIAEFEQIARRV